MGEGKGELGWVEEDEVKERVSGGGWRRVGWNGGRRGCAGEGGGGVKLRWVWDGWRKVRWRKVRWRRE